MNPVLKHAFSAEMRTAAELYQCGELERCFYHLERAHVLGQRAAVPHTISHWWMLKVGIRRGDGREIVGQLARIAIGGIGSVLGRAPIGNTGGADVGILTPMPIPPDLQAIFDRAERGGG